jgi:hypothetical protein
MILRYVSKGETELHMIFGFAVVFVVMEFEDGVTKAREWKLPELKAAVVKVLTVNLGYGSLDNGF